MKMKEAEIHWNIYSKKVAVCDRDQSRTQVSWTGDTGTRWSVACHGNAGNSTPEEFHLAILFVNFHTAVVRDGIDPHDLHNEMLKIDEYRQTISPDIEGAGQD